MKRYPLILAALLCTPAMALTPEDAEARLRMAMQIAREHNDAAKVAQVERVWGHLKKGLTENAETEIAAAEKVVGIDPGGWSMAGQPLAKPTPEMLTKSKELGQRLHEAMLSEDAEKVRAVTAEMLKVLGDQAGVPDGRRLGHRPVGKELTQAEATALFIQALKTQGRAVRQLREGKPLPNQMMRIYGYILSGLAEVRPWLVKHQPEELVSVDALASGCANVMMTLQQPAGYFPFPDLRGKNIRFGEMIERQIKAGLVQVKDGWVITADPDGGTQFDTGVCGVALLKAGEAFENKTWLEAGKRAADWALEQKCCGNFNYNALSISLLAHQYRLSQEARYLEGALKKLRVGVAPGLAPNGRWMDAHNARTVYHLIILRALGDLASVMPEHSEVDAIARPALKALLDEFDAMGITVEALPELEILHRLYPEDERLKAALSQMASSLIEKCTEGGQIKMGAQPDQLAALAGVSKNR